MNRLDRSLLAIFSAEQAEHLASIRSALERLTAQTAGVRALALEELLRRLHTLKGAARAVGLEQTEMLTHQSEDVLASFRKGEAGPPEEVADVLSRTADAIEDILAAAAADRNAPDLAELRARLSSLSNSAAPALSAIPEPLPVSETEAPVPHATQYLRVESESVMELIRDTSGLLIDSQTRESLTQLEEWVTRLEGTSAEWARLRRASGVSVSALGHDPAFRPAGSCLTFMDSRLEGLMRDARRVSELLHNAIGAVRSRSAAVYQAACQIRMTPAESVFASFAPMVRDLARENGREVRFEAAGLAVSADLLVLQGLKDPVMHVLRNAVSHGIESPEERQRAGKSREGEIRLMLSCRGDRLDLVVEDDGRGIDYEAIEREGRAQGLLAPDEVLEHEEDFKRLMLHAGFSTAKAVTGVSGRGLGLAIVEAAVRRLHGGIELLRRPGGGTRVVISAPVSISTEHVLLVSVNGFKFGIATAHVETVLSIAMTEIRNVNDREVIPTQSGPVRVQHLSSVLGLTSGRDADKQRLPCVVLTLNRRRMAFVVDELVDDRDATIKDTGLYDDEAGATSGAIPMDDGTVAVMLNVNALFEMAGRNRAVTAAPPARKVVRKLRILVADDSLTTRSLEKNILEANGYEVRLAVDGLEAFEMMRVEVPDLVISDVSMPRMTGFQLLEQVRKHPTLGKVPVILMTSLETREEQEMGLSLGADAYIVKRKFDQRELLNLIREIV